MEGGDGGRCEGQRKNADHSRFNVCQGKWRQCKWCLCQWCQCKDRKRKRKEKGEKRKEKRERRKEKE